MKSLHYGHVERKNKTFHKKHTSKLLKNYGRNTLQMFGMYSPFNFIDWQSDYTQDLAKHCVTVK